MQSLQSPKGNIVSDKSDSKNESDKLAFKPTSPLEFEERRN